MKIGVIVHQQICQLRWHLLACLGLLMVLPIEEAIVSLRAGDGFYSDRMMFAALSFSPLLAGLIACANVQADLNDRRYIFWRSKPANVKLLIVLKFFSGLVAFIVIVACPVIFATVTCALANESFYNTPFPKYYFAFFSLIGIMVFSLCFGCNVLVRNTARSWLIGMFLAGLVLVIPFMLPLGFTDIVSDVGMWAFGFYPAFILVVSTTAFIFSLYAAHYDWHLRTNPKGLLCVGAGLVFVLLMLFSSQVANIRVLDEEKTENLSAAGTFDRVGNKIIFQGKEYVDVSRDKILPQNVGSNGASVVAPPDYWPVGTDSEGRRVVYGPRSKDFYRKDYPGTPDALYMDTAEGMYYFGVTAYFRQEGEAHRVKHFYEEVYLRSYKLVGDSWQVIRELDLSDCLGDRKNYILMAMRLIDKTLVTCVNFSVVAVDVTQPEEMKEIDKKLDVIPRRPRWLADEERHKEFSIPLVPIEGISTEDKIRFSIDLLYRFYDRDNHIYDSSMVDIHNDKIAFFSVSEGDVARFDVVRWDQENIYCKFSVARPFTALETVVGLHGWIGPDDRIFVQDHRLYFKQNQQLVVFDVGSDRRIRKLGHFFRMDCNIEDVAVDEDGRILLCARLHRDSGGKNSSGETRHLYLLENPQ